MVFPKRTLRINKRINADVQSVSQQEKSLLCATYLSSVTLTSGMRSLNTKMHQQRGALKCGWAQSIVRRADIRALYQPRLPPWGCWDLCNREGTCNDRAGRGSGRGGSLGNEGMIDVSWAISQPSTSSRDGERETERQRTSVNLSDWRNS